MYDANQYSWIWREVKHCPVYHPTQQQCEDPLLYLHSIAEEASQYGICKVIPPLQVFIPSTKMLMNHTKFETFVHPLRADMNNGATITYSKGRKLSPREFLAFAKKASTDWYGSSQGIGVPMYLESEFWHELLHRQDKEVLIGVNQHGQSFIFNLFSRPLWIKQLELKEVSEASKLCTTSYGCRCYSSNHS